MKVGVNGEDIRLGQKVGYTHGIHCVMCITCTFTKEKYLQYFFTITREIKGETKYKIN